MLLQVDGRGTYLHLSADSSAVPLYQGDTLVQHAAHGVRFDDYHLKMRCLSPGSGVGQQQCEVKVKYNFRVKHALNKTVSGVR